MYVPILKNRMYENKFIKENVYLFDSNIIPMIEVIFQKIGRTNCSIKDIISEYEKHFKNKYFIDFFTFAEKEYTAFDPSKVEFPIKIRDEKELNYLNDLLLVVARTKKGIPVISIKRARNFILDTSIITKIIEELQKETENIAIRIESNIFEYYFDYIHPLLRETDYLFYDINEESIVSKFFDIQKINNKQKEYKIIIINSPRKSRFNNSNYKNCSYTNLIDNSIRDEFVNYGFDGFADYAGLKNELPTDGGNGKGAALGLFYLDKQNKFFSIMNQDTNKGPSGYRYVLYEAFHNYRNLLDTNRDCPAFFYMNNVLVSKNKTGTWPQWKYITILRYISQIKKSTK